MKSNTTVIVKKKDSIVFQLSALNLLMLVSFLVVMFMVMSAMKTSTTSSINMFDSMMDLTTHEAKLKSDVMNLYDQTKKDWEEEYFRKIRENPLACLVKCLDRVNNLSGMADGFDEAGMIRYTKETDKYYPALLEIVGEVPAWNDARWLLRYQMTALEETFKRLL